MTDMITTSQLPATFKALIEEQTATFNTRVTVEERNSIPDTSEIPIADRNHWLRIKDVSCVFLDMKNSTQMSVSADPRGTASIYQYFSDTAVRIFNEVDCPYIDIRGDGVFGLFNHNQIHTALASAIIFKTFITDEFLERVKAITQSPLGIRIGIDRKSVLVKKLGLKKHGDRTDRQNEVWAGKPVNMAAKLASFANNNEIVVSDRFFQQIKSDAALISCGCGEAGKPIDLWTDKPLENDTRFDFNKIHILLSRWCPTHGAEYCKKLLDSDGEKND